MDRCECVKCLGTLTQNFRTRQRHMEKYGCSERANQQCAERTPNSRLAAHSSPTPSTPVNDNEHSPTFGSQSEQLDPDYDPILQQQMNPSDTESDSENGKLNNFLPLITFVLRSRLLDGPLLILTSCLVPLNSVQV